MGTVEISPCYITIYWIVACLFTLFYTMFAFKIHSTSKALLKTQKDSHNYSWFIHQRWFNFIGAAIGWIILWILLPEIIGSIRNQSLDSVTFIDFLFLLTSILGITGHLPLTLFGISINATNTINKMTSNT